MYGRLVAKRASLIAASTTSVPELPRYVRARPLIGAIRRQLATDLGIDRQVEVAMPRNG